MRKWKVLRKTYHNGAFIHPGQVIEENDRFDGAPNMEVFEEPVVFEAPKDRVPPPEPIKDSKDTSKGAE